MSPLSSSIVQREAERWIVDQLAIDLGKKLVVAGPIRVGDGGACVEVDARSDSGDVLIEAFARQGGLKAGQLKKVRQDILKFALLRRQEEYEESTMIIAFACPEARSSVTGWAAEAARAFDVELRVVTISDDQRSKIKSAQERQVMVNRPADEIDAVDAL